MDNKKTKSNKKLKKGLWLVFLTVLIAASAAFAAGVYQGKIPLALKMAERYEVKGVDVSYYQGEIDWQILSKDISFVYMKATEGSSHRDVRFEQNLEHARQTELAVGAYHFFSFESSGKTQADNYIAVVGTWEGMLAPAVDVEYYSGYAGTEDVEEIREELRCLLDELEAYYGCKPVIYTTMTAYRSFIRGEFSDYPLWIRNVYYQPVSSGREWTFWQYHAKGTLEGYSGEEKYIDLDVFRGSREELENYKLFTD